MKKDEGFYFIPKKWLGDANVISMDWDCKGMHLHLMAIAWQQPLQGYIIDDENLILKVLGLKKFPLCTLMMSIVGNMVKFF